MSHFTPRPSKSVARPQPNRRRFRPLAGAAVGGVTVIVVAVLVVAGTGAGSSGPERIGEVNAMGMPVIETPGTSSGRTDAAGITVDGATWELGQVPLNVAVRPAWTLHNTGDTPVELGEPHPEVREGCCPGPVVLGTRSLAPGESTELTFELSMHPGMDGPHDLALHVPVDPGASNAELLTLVVTGDFRD